MKHLGDGNDRAQHHRRNPPLSSTARNTSIRAMFRLANPTASVQPSLCLPSKNPLRPCQGARCDAKREKTRPGATSAESRLSKRLIFQMVEGKGFEPSTSRLSAYLPE